MNLSKPMADLKQIYASRENPLQRIAELEAKNKRLELSNKAYKIIEVKRKNIKKHL